MTFSALISLTIVYQMECADSSASLLCYCYIIIIVWRSIFFTIFCHCPWGFSCKALDVFMLWNSCQTKAEYLHNTAVATSLIIHLLANGFTLFISLCLCYPVNIKITSGQTANSECLDLVLLPTTKQNKLGKVSPWWDEEAFVLFFVLIKFI